MTLIEAHRDWKSSRQTEMVREVRTKLDHALRRHLLEINVWIYGSLAKPERFHADSDVDIAISGLPAGISIDYLQSLLSRDIGREVDICLLEKTRLKESILREGERWAR